MLNLLPCGVNGTDLWVCKPMGTMPQGSPLLLDTNVLTYYTRLVLSDEVTQRAGDALRNQRAFVSVITRI